MKKIRKYIRNFKLVGIYIIVLKLIMKVSSNIHFIKKKYDEIIIDFLERNIYKQLSYNKNKVKQISDEKYIFVFWWDGFENAPDIVQICIQSLKNMKGYTVVMLDKRNVTNYVKLDDWIWSKFKNGIISVTHLSDIIRVNLLSRYNCIWADATILLSGDIKDLDKYSLFSIRGSLMNKYVSENKWTAFFMSSNGCQDIFNGIDCFLQKYWQKYNVLIDYYLIDYVYEIVYRNDENFKKCIDKLPLYNEIYLLSNQMLFSNDIEKCRQIYNNNKIHKLSWKLSYKVNLKEIIDEKIELNMK